MDTGHILKLLLLFFIGCISSIINVNAGGGSSLTLPALIFLGLDSAVANGTNRIGILVQNIAAVWSFRRKKIHAFRESLLLSLFTLPGAVIGALVSINLSDEWFQRILAVVMIGTVASMLFIKSPGSSHSEQKAKRSWLIYPAMLGIGFYGGFIQVGVGFLFMASLFHILRESLIRVNMHKVFIVLIYTIPALIVFSWTGKVNWMYGLVLAGGSWFGGWLGTHLAVKGGEKGIRLILIAAILIMALKLLGLF
jgi:uncharacterized membrane protein YfcA